LAFGPWLLAFGLWLLDLGFCFLLFGSWLLDLVFCFLLFAFWILAFRFCLLAFVLRCLFFPLDTHVQLFHLLARPGSFAKKGETGFNTRIIVEATDVNDAPKIFPAKMFN
jgi:hypothetical protein